MKIDKSVEGKRVLIRKTNYLPINEYLIKEISPSGEYMSLKPLNGHSHSYHWNRCDEYELIEILEYYEK